MEGWHSRKVQAGKRWGMEKVVVEAGQIQAGVQAHKAGACPVGQWKRAAGRYTVWW